MEIDLTKPEVPLEDIEDTSVSVSSNALRGRIRELISSFMMKPQPVGPTEADILNDFLRENDPSFLTLNVRIVELSEQLETSPARSRRRISGLLEEARAERLEKIARTASSPEFMKYRSRRKAEYNEELARYEEEALVIRDLKPFLGMPYLPNIEANSLAPDVILTVLSGISKTPMKGQMVLMLDENVHAKPQFFPRSALTTGLPHRLHSERGRRVIRIPYSPNERLGVEALSQGAFERSGHVFFKVEDGRPLSYSTWPEIDRYLPFACRSISVPLLPLVSPLASGFDFAEVFGEAPWRIIEEEVLEKHASTCMVCGSDRKVRVFPRWRFREPVNGSFSPGVQQLEGFIPFCSDCAFVLRPSLDDLLTRTNTGYTLRLDKERKDWLRVINRWTDQRCADFPKDAYLLAIEAHRRRAKTNWIIDLSAQRSIFFQLQPGFRVEQNGWIWPKAGAPFKVVGAPFYEGSDQLRNFFQKPSIFDVEWGSTVSDVMRMMEDDYDMAVVDESGLGTELEVAREDPMPLSPAMEKNLERVATDDVETIEVDTASRPADAAFENDDPSPVRAPATGADDEEDDWDDDDDDVSSMPDYHERFAASDTGFS